MAALGHRGPGPALGGPALCLTWCLISVLGLGLGLGRSSASDPAHLSTAAMAHSLGLGPGLGLAPTAASNQAAAAPTPGSNEGSTATTSLEHVFDAASLATVPEGRGLHHFHLQALWDSYQQRE